MRIHSLRKCVTAWQGPLLAGLLAALAPARVPAQRAARACRAEAGTPRPLYLANKRAFFVEPQAVAALPDDSDIVVAGTPTYVWPEIPGNLLPSGRDSILGVRIRNGREVIPIMSPVPELHVNGVRALATSRDTYEFILGTGPRAAHFEDDAVITALWSATWSSSGWSSVKRLPDPPGSVVMERLTQPARAGDDLAFAVPTRSGDRTNVALYVRNSAGWRVIPFRTRAAAYLAVLGDTGAVTVGVVQADTLLSFDRNSLFLYKVSLTGDSVTSATRVVQGGEVDVHAPMLTRTNDGHHLIVWESHGPTAFGAVAMPENGKVRILTDRGIQQALSPGSIGRTPVTVQLTGEGNTMHVQVTALRADSILTLVNVPSPFYGVIGATMSNHALAIVGPVRGRTPAEPAVALALQAITVHCP